MYLRKDRYRLTSINKCRLYVKCFFISELMNEEGYVDRRYLTGEKIREYSEINLPKLQKPTPLEFSEWKDFIFRNFLAGPFKVHPPIQETYTPEKYEDSTDEVLLLQRIEMTQRTIKEIIDILPSELRMILGNIDIPQDDGVDMAQAIEEGRLVGASDGSVIKMEEEDRGGHSYILQYDTTCTNRIQGYGPTPVSDEVTSTTTEHFGFLGLLITTYIITTKYNISTTKPIHLYSDSKETIKRMKDTKRPVNISDTQVADYDIWQLAI